jgi:hypothetical protein
MKLKHKATLYSLLVFPGAGYFFLDRMQRGFVAMFLSLGGLAVLTVEAFHKAQVLAEKIVYGELPYDINVIRQQIPLTPGVLDERLVIGITLSLLLLWLFACVDSYRIGQVLEASDFGLEKSD